MQKAQICKLEGNPTSEKYYEAKAILFQHSIQYGVKNHCFIQSVGNEIFDKLTESSYYNEIGTFVYVLDNYTQEMKKMFLPYISILEQLKTENEKRIRIENLFGVSRDRSFLCH